MILGMSVVYLSSFLSDIPASIIYNSRAGRYRPVSFPDGPITTAIDLCRMLTGIPIFHVHNVGLDHAFKVL